MYNLTHQLRTSKATITIAEISKEMDEAVWFKTRGHLYTNEFQILRDIREVTMQETKETSQWLI